MKNSKFQFYSRISGVEREGKDIYIKGVASSTSIDDYETIFSEECQRGWIEDLNSQKPTYIEMYHDGIKEFDKRIGRVTEAWVEDNPNKVGIKDFWIKAKLSKKSARAKELLRIMQDPDVESGEPAKLGLSINGYVIDYDLKEINGKMIKVFTRTRLLLVGVTEYPANSDSYNLSISRSLDEKELENKILVMRGQKMSNEDLEMTVPEVSVEVVIPEVEAVVESIEREAEIISSNVEVTTVTTSVEATVLEVVEREEVAVESSATTSVEQITREEVKEVVEVVSVDAEAFEALKREVEILKGLVEELKVSKEEVLERSNSKDLVFSEFSKEVKESVESLKRENEVLREKLEEYGKKPSSSIASQIIPQFTQERSLTKEDILALAEAGKLSSNSMERLQRAIIKSL